MFYRFGVARRSSRLLLPVIVVVSLAACSSITVAAPRPESVFDDFGGPAGSGPDPKYWVYDIGSSADHGWEAGGLQTYTNSTDNVRLDGRGHLILEARKSGSHYTSGRLTTRGKVSMLYGTMAARIKFPSGQGIWPAFWMLGSNMDTVGWPQCGEIDLLELVSNPSTYYTTIHGPITGSSDTQQAQFSGPISDLSTDYHDYWVTRIPDRITIGIDKTILGTFTPQSLPPGAQWVFNHPMYAILNVAVGGDWPGPPDASTPFPATMLVNWFRFDPSGP